MKALASISDQKNPNLRAVARAFDLNYDTLVGRYHGRKPRTSNIPINKALNPVQEAALIRYIKQLDELWAPCTLQEIERCANSILARSKKGPVSKMWASRFVRRLPEDFFWIK